MNNDVMNLSEKDVQCFIADYPWLLNIDYEVIPELKNKGMEYQLSDNKRADLILKDRKSDRPVIVEFKAVPFYRENIGQILEYKARIINEYSNNSSILKDIFQQNMLSPILILVVPKCSCEARLACNLAGIDIYEYYKSVPEIMLPEKKKTLDNFIDDIKNDDIPFSDDRNERISKIYTKIHELLLELNLADGWKNYKRPSGEYFCPLNNLFVNKYLFENNDISIGIFENVFEDISKITIEYCSDSSKKLKKFADEYEKLDMKPTNLNHIDNDTYDLSCWSFAVEKKEFLNNTQSVIKPFIINYIKIMENLKLMN